MPLTVLRTAPEVSTVPRRRRFLKDRRLRVGDRVLVRSPEEILATLDADGTLDGVPFMPEMLDSCGKPFRVLRRVEKTCVDAHPMRRFPRTTW